MMSLKCAEPRSVVRTVGFGVLFVGFICSVAGCGGGSRESASSGRALGKLQVIKGSVTLTRGQGVLEIAAGAETNVSFGDVLKSRAETDAVVTAGRQVHLLKENSELRFESMAGEGTRVHLLQGIATFLLPPTPDKRSPFEAVSNSVVAAVKGTIFRFGTSGTEVQVTVLRGEVEVQAGKDGPIKLVKATDRVVARLGKIDSAPILPDEVSKIRTEILLKKQALKIDVATF